MKIIIQAIFVLFLSVSLWSCSEKKTSSGDVYFNRGEYAKAANEYTEDLKFKPNDVRMLYNRGRANEEQGNYEEAKADFEKALEVEPNNFQVLLSLANVHYNQKNYTNALLYSDQAAEIPGAPAMASFMKARALHQLGKPDEALKAYGNAIAVDKDFGQAYFNRGLLKVAMKKVGASCEDFQLAKALEYPGAAEAFDKYCK
ncbi:tetratricopeptide repeat protein [Algoriphagus yeomjeoni]|uniref:Anaphase-promoting complex subunit 3 n=1 Tax=Algoriphagus yeomjeoni TaxID=291403 RepID=A0A327PJC1_9BACT|nr:tetratricopeptide repeat protein [Algoriphagus yeomjeoni]RAI91471.1 anaphase-promoting complex subunit 3 [Algoriphagus yeomjeoni]